MTRPKSHRQQIPGKRCENCKFCHRVAYKTDLLCFHGDAIEVIGHYGRGDHIEINGEEIGLLSGDEYDEIWGGRVVDPDEICDEWEGDSTIRKSDD